MNNKTNNTMNVSIRQKLELYLSRWKIITLCIIVALALGFISLRYATYEYRASATIKIRDENQSKKLPSIEGIISNGGLFSDGTNKIKDEVQTMLSRTLIRNAVKELKLNTRFFKVGNIKELEVYRNPPIKLNFFASDSIIQKVDTTLFVKIKSQTEFMVLNYEEKSIFSTEPSEGKNYTFGDKIKTSFGDIVITPNTGEFSPLVGDIIKVQITPISNIINHYIDTIIIGTQEGSSVVSLELQDTHPERAVDILNEIIKQYNNDVLNDKEELIRVTTDFIENRLQEVSKELEKVDYTAEQLQKKNKLTALASQADINLQNERDTEAQIANTSNKIQMISFLENEINSTDRITELLPQDIGLGDPNIAQITKSYNSLVAQKNKLLKTSSEQNPVVINLNDQINALKLNLQNSLTNMKKTSELTLNNLDKRRSRIRGQLYGAPTQARQFRNLERQQGIKESLYLFLLEKREESAVRLGMYVANAKIIDKAYASSLPVAPNSFFTYLAALLAGLILPISFIYFMDILDTKLYTKDDLNSVLEIPYLGDIPKTSKKEKLIKKVDYSPKAEAFRILRSNIDFLLKDLSKNQKRLFVTSTKAQEGKSHTSTNLASSISFSEKKVLLIEMDIRVPKILDYLNISKKSSIGLTDYIADKTIKPQDVVIKHPDNEFLDILPSGSIPPNPSELLMSPRVQQLFNYFENKYDYIIADTSAVGLVSDTLLISDLADLFIYVVSVDNVDKRKLANIAKPLYDDKRLPNMTILLNGVKSGKKGYGYGYGYGNNPHKKKKWYQFSKS